MAPWAWPGGDHRVDQHAVIVNRGVSLEAHLAGVAVDLDLGDMGAVGEGHPFPGPGVIGVEWRTLTRLSSTTVAASWPAATLGIAPSTAIVASAPIRPVPTPGRTPASVVRTSPAPVRSLFAVIPVWRAMRRNPSAPPLAPMTGHRVPTRAAAAPHLDNAGCGAHPDRSLA
jgi:hypothetical protein